MVCLRSPSSVVSELMTGPQTSGCGKRANNTPRMRKTMEKRGYPQQGLGLSHSPLYDPKGEAPDADLGWIGGQKHPLHISPTSQDLSLSKASPADRRPQPQLSSLSLTVQAFSQIPRLKYLRQVDRCPSLRFTVGDRGTWQ